MRQINKMSETLMPARPRSGKRRSFIVWIQLKKMRLNFTGSTRRGTRMLPYLPGVHSPQWVYRPLDRLHQGHSAPSSSSTKNSFPNPTPCSPVSEKTDPWVSALHGLASHDAQDFQVPSSVNACLTMRGMGRRTAWSTSSVLKAEKVWKFPSVP